MKKFISLLLAVLMVASLAACGSKEPAPAADGEIQADPGSRSCAGMQPSAATFLQAEHGKCPRRNEPEPRSGEARV